MLDYLSPSGYRLYKQDKEKFYLEYVLRDRRLRGLQTKPMAIGSCFDAHVKSYLHKELLGANHKDSDRFIFDKILTDQVEGHNLISEILDGGAYIFKAYQSSGALADLLLEMNLCISEPHFEFEIKSKIESQEYKSILGHSVLSPLILLGKPDLFYVNREGAHVIHDWKVNGYFSVASPTTGYVKIREGMTSNASFNFKSHKSCVPTLFKGLYINTAATLETVNLDWATQLSIYAWLLGEDVGSEVISSVDQVACKSNISQAALPSLRFASHRCLIGSSFQKELFLDLNRAWEDIHSEHYFKELSLEDSKKRCELLKLKAGSELSKMTDML